MLWQDTQLCGPGALWSVESLVQSAEVSWKISSSVQKGLSPPFKDALYVLFVICGKEAMLTFMEML